MRPKARSSIVIVAGMVLGSGPTAPAMHHGLSWKMRPTVLQRRGHLGRDLVAGDHVVDIGGRHRGIDRADPKKRMTQAREKAIEDALTQALKAAMTSVLLPGLSPLKFQEAWRRISDKQADYIQKYGIKGESSDQRAYRVRVNATLFVDVIAVRLRSRATKPSPKIILIKR